MVEVDGEFLLAGGGDVGVGVVEAGHGEGVVEVDDFCVLGLLVSGGWRRFRWLGFFRWLMAMAVTWAGVGLVSCWRRWVPVRMLPWM